MRTCSNGVISMFDVSDYCMHQNAPGLFSDVGVAGNFDL